MPDCPHMTGSDRCTACRALDELETWMNRYRAGDATSEYEVINAAYRLLRATGRCRE